jgi:hypothetical protein
MLVINARPSINILYWVKNLGQVKKVLFPFRNIY